MPSISSRFVSSLNSGSLDSECLEDCDGDLGLFDPFFFFRGREGGIAPVCMGRKLCKWDGEGRGGTGYVLRVRLLELAKSSFPILLTFRFMTLNMFMLLGLRRSIELPRSVVDEDTLSAMLADSLVRLRGRET